jgi:translation initiation factor IF-2
MEKDKPKRLSKIAKEFNLGIHTIVDFLSAQKIEIESNPNAKIEPEVYEILLKEFQSDKADKEKSKKISTEKVERTTISIENTKTAPEPIIEREEPKEIIIKNIENTSDDSISTPEESGTKDVKVVGKIDLSSLNQKTRPTKEVKKQEEPVKAPEPKAEEKPKEVEKEVETKREEPEHIKTEYSKMTGPSVIGKIDLPIKQPKKEPVKPQPVASSNEDEFDRKKKRKRIAPVEINKIAAEKPRFNKDKNKPAPKQELTEEQIQSQIKETLARLSGGSGKSKSSKFRRAKRDAVSQKQEAELEKIESEKSILKVTEFVTANELANMMDISVNEVIAACMSLGLFVSINQRLDAETLSIVAEEFGFSVEFISAKDQEIIAEIPDEESTLIGRPPIVTVMGHVDHGKTSLLDYIRKTNVIKGEAGGITQHIGAYSVSLEDGRKITFLDTPGHEAFTAMRARGAQITDIVIIVIAADDNVMPQTKEAINHAQAAGVPMIIAINKIDKPGANPDKIREELSAMNILVEDWGGKFQCQEISAKNGINIEELLEKVLLEAEIMDLKANPNKNAVGTVIESALDKGRGYVTTILVQSGTLKVGDVILAGAFSGKIKAMHNERGQTIKEAGPSIPVSILGLSGSPNAGDKFNVLDDEREARNIAAKRAMLQREQGIRTQKHITLDEIGRRLAIGDFKELNVIVKGDVDGSIEALSDSLLKLSTEKVQVKVIHKSVGQISESDVLLASASDAIIIGFQVRPSTSARKIAENEEIDIRLYSVIYDAVEEIKAAMEGMLDAKIEEKIVCNIEIRETFKITKVGTIAGCYVLDGKVNRNTKIRIIRDGIVIHSGTLGSLKRFKDDVKEVTSGYECGLNITNFNDIQVGDIIEGYEEFEVKQKL